METKAFKAHNFTLIIQPVECCPGIMFALKMTLSLQDYTYFFSGRFGLFRVFVMPPSPPPPPDTWAQSGFIIAVTAAQKQKAVSAHFSLFTAFADRCH